MLRYIRDRQLVRAGDRVCLAVSGGADSVALLRALLELRKELGIVLSVTHFNHQLRGEASDADQVFVAALARACDLEFSAGHGPVRAHATQNKLTLEAASRELRYEWFREVASLQALDVIATGHTLDDQAETVIMKFLRGAGTRGMAGIYPELNLESARGDLHAFSSAPEKMAGRDSFGRKARVRLVRPLLEVTRAEVEAYLTSIAQSWREDESNLDSKFTRNRVRHGLLPLLERDYNPNIRQVLSETAEVARAEEDYWKEFAAREMATRMVPVDTLSLRLDAFAALPAAARRRLLKAFLERAGCGVDFEHIQNLLRCAAGQIESAALPGGWQARRENDCLRLLSCRQGPLVGASLEGYSYLFSIPGRVYLKEIGLTLQAVIVPQQVAGNAWPGTLLAAERVGPELTVRNWQPGDRYRPAHGRSVEKLKRLFSEKKIPEVHRRTWPVILNGDDIVWVRGFPIGQGQQWSGKGDAVLIEAEAFDRS